MTMWLPVARPAAVRTAAPLPRLRGWVCTLTRASAASPARIAAVPSVLPSSTTTSSTSHGYGTSSTRLTTAATVSASL